MPPAATPAPGRGRGRGRGGGKATDAPQRAADEHPASEGRQRGPRRRGEKQQPAAAHRDPAADSTSNPQPVSAKRGADDRPRRGRGRGGAQPAAAAAVRERDAAASDDEYGAPAPKGRGGRKPKNTENFNPSHTAPDIRVVVDPAAQHMSIRPQVRDLTLHPTLFAQPGDEQLYERLVSEIEAYNKSHPGRDLLKSWHGDSHWIADDSTGWKKHAPTFRMVIERIQKYFNMDIKATRFNWYKDQSEWKPYHHDAAAVKPQMAKIQNFTVGVSFGCTRDAAFECAETKKVISLPLANGSTYCFARDTNILWRHGILQVPPQQQRAEGRISVIAWGWVDQDEVNAPPARMRKSA